MESRPVPENSSPTSRPPIAEAGSQARATGIVSVAILCSRVLGLVRDQLLNGLFGSAFTGIFSRAFATPNMLRDLFAEGALSTAFVTTFSKRIATEGDESAWRLGRKMLTLAFCFMVVVSVAGVALAPWIIRLLVPGWDEPAKALCASLAQIMYPFIILVSMTALVMGMLNAKRVYFIPAVASAFFNLGCIVGGLVLAWIIDPGFREWKVTERGLTAFAIGTLIGGVFQLAVQLPSLHRAGFRFRADFRWKDEGVREVLRLMWPSLIAAGGTQVNVLLNTIFASFTWGEERAAAWLGNAQRLQQLPLGLFGVAVATVTLPALSRAATGGLSPQFRELLARGLRLVLFLTLPCAFGLALLSNEIISVIFEHGLFTAEDVRQTASALQAYAFGLVFYAGIKVIQPAFYAIDKRFLPMCVSLGVIAFNVAVNSITVFGLGWDHTALAWATAAGLALNFSALYLSMRRFAGRLETRLLIGTIARIGIAAAAIAGICLAARHWLFDGWAEFRLIRQIGLLGATILAAAITYFALTSRLRVAESDEFLSLLRKRLGRK
jgi:putative peptidoglycan lipid II flippase